MANKLTHDEEIAYRVALRRDGWEATTTPIAVARTFKRNGYTLQFINGTVAAWGPDDLSIEPGTAYDFKALEAGLWVCGQCKVVGPTMRLAFCNRVCSACRERLKDTWEYKGWAD